MSMSIFKHVNVKLNAPICFFASDRSRSFFSVHILMVRRQRANIDAIACSYSTINNFDN